MTIARALSIPVTTGDSYTVAIALEAARLGTRKVGIELRDAAAAVAGATGAIGSVMARLLARETAELILIGRRMERLRELARRIEGPARLRLTTEMAEVAGADLVIAVTSAAGPLIEPQHLRRGAVVCDVARPRNVSARVARERDDVLVIDGGMVKVPGEVDFGFDFGFPPRTAYACMAEVMILALENRLESFTRGRSISLEQVRTIAALGQKHGFELAGFRAFDRPVSDEEVARVRARRAQN